MRRTTLATAIAVIALGFGACGGDDEEPAATPAPTAEEGGGGGGGQAVDVAADADGKLAFQQKTLEAPAGAVSFSFENPASVPHDFCIEQDGQEVGCTDQITESSATLDEDLQAGEYAFYCSVPGHRAAGMEGTLTVQ